MSWWLGILTAIVNALFGQIRQGVDEKRDDQAHRDAGAATERASTNAEAAKAADAMAEAQVNAGPAETALEQGLFLIAPAGAPKAMLDSVSGAAARLRAGAKKNAPRPRRTRAKARPKGKRK